MRVTNIYGIKPIVLDERLPKKLVPTGITPPCLFLLGDIQIAHYCYDLRIGKIKNTMHYVTDGPSFKVDNTVLTEHKLKSIVLNHIDYLKT